MTDFRMSEALELKECQRMLELALHKLDQVGAGIAAIHVNAAIEQLKSNIKTVKECADSDSSDASAGGSDEARVTH